MPFLDLQATFAADYARNARRFEFAYDWHWNVLGNRLAGEAIAAFLLRIPGVHAGPLADQRWFGTSAARLTSAAL